QQDVNSPSLVSCFLLDLHQQSQTVHGVDELDKRQSALDLVALQMADEMPADAPGQDGGFTPEFLWPALAEIEDTKFRQQSGHFRTDYLGDSHELHVTALTAGTAAGRGDALLHNEQTLLECGSKFLAIHGSCSGAIAPGRLSPVR